MNIKTGVVVYIVYENFIGENLNKNICSFIISMLKTDRRRYSLKKTVFIGIGCINN